MGGYGSGRRTRWASKSEDFHKIDLATFNSEWFVRGRSGTITWSRGGHKSGSISYRTNSKQLRLTYTTGRDENRMDVDETFELTYTKQNLGGQRRWILCKCGRRCRVLFGGKFFRCGQCYKVTYQSQYERFRVPGMSAAEKARERLGFDMGFAYSFGSKPKGMHWRTYYALRERDWETSAAIERALTGHFEKYL